MCVSTAASERKREEENLEKARRAVEKRNAANLHKAREFSKATTRKAIERMKHSSGGDEDPDEAEVLPLFDEAEVLPLFGIFAGLKHWMQNWGP